MMKRHFRFLFTVAMTLAVSAQVALAYDSDSDSESETQLYPGYDKKFVHFTLGKKLTVDVGARGAVDAAYYFKDATSLDSGFALTDAVVEGEINYLDLITFKIDINVEGSGSRDLYLEYHKDAHSVKGGFFRDPSSLSLNTDQAEYRFVSRSATSNALINDARVFGLDYKYTNKSLHAEASVFTNNGPSDYKLKTNFSNMGGAGRFLFRPNISDVNVLHIGVNARYISYENPETVTLSGGLETNVDCGTNFLYAEVENVKTDYSIGAEALYMSDKYFVRGEYTRRYLTKERDDQSLFDAQNDALTGYTTLEAWQAANPICTNAFSGFYVEGGFLLMGDRYEYNQKKGQVGSLLNSRNVLELVARYNYTCLNDITEGDVFAVDRFYQNGNPYDTASNASSVGGGQISSITVGANYYISKGVVFMLNYTYSNVTNPYYADDTNISMLQARLFVRF